MTWPAISDGRSGRSESCIPGPSSLSPRVTSPAPMPRPSTRARLRLDQGRPNPVWTPWRATAALALAHQGRQHEAAVLAAEELALAERFGAPAAILAATHAAAVAETDDAQRLALCETALRRAGQVRLGARALADPARARSRSQRDWDAASKRARRCSWPWRTLIAPARRCLPREHAASWSPPDCDRDELRPRAWRR